MLRLPIRIILLLVLLTSFTLANACRRDSDCDDGNWCNGVERCEGVIIDSVNSRVIEGQCASGSPPCGSDRNFVCLPKEQRCSSAYGPACDGSGNDRDADGSIAIACGGDDCDDNNPNRYPGNTEICNEVDEDCDPATLGDDLDGDGYVSVMCAN